MKPLISIGIVLMAILFSLQYAPPISPQGRDSGAFAYTAQVILDGGMPYRDSWDHKPPMVFFWDALAFLALGEGRWALWTLETMTVAAASVVLYVALGIALSDGAAVIGVLVSIAVARNANLVEGGNFTEIYALLPQALILLAGLKFYLSGRPVWLFTAATATSIAIMTRPTTIALGLTLMPAFLLAGPATRDISYRSVLKWLLAGLVGVILPILFIISYLKFGGALQHAFDAVVIYNLGYGEPVGIRSVVESMVATIVLCPIATTAMAFGVPGGLYRLLSGTKSVPAMRMLVVWGLVSLPLELILINLSGRSFFHYYISLAVPCSIWAGMAVSLPRNGCPLLAAFRNVALISLCIAFSIWSTGALLDPLNDPSAIFSGDGKYRLAWCLQENSSPSDTVLVWGAASYINFQANRRSPTGFSYNYPLLRQTKYFEQFMVDLSGDPPDIVVGVDETAPKPLRDWVASHCRADEACLRYRAPVGALSDPYGFGDRMLIYRCGSINGK